MTFNESNAKITESFTGRTIDHVVRNGKILEFHTTCGHCIKLQSDVNHDIHFGGQDVRIVLDAIQMGVAQGQL